MKNANPLSYISGVEPPFLIIHGDSDDVVALRHSQVLFDALCASRGHTNEHGKTGNEGDGAASRYHELLVEQGAGHGKDGAFGPWWPKPSRYNWDSRIVNKIDEFLRERVFSKQHSDHERSL